MTQVIYETSGRAREYNELAINLYTGCEHACVYCYGADVLHKDKAAFIHNVKPRVTPDDIERSAKEWTRKNERRRILMCFVTDPYTPCEEQHMLTRDAIRILHKYGLNVIILTKGGLRATRDFDLLSPRDAYATTLTCMNAEDSLKWEPFAAVPEERIQTLQEAHNRGIETWVSLEPVIYPEDSIALVGRTREFVGHFKVGLLNYHEHGKTINWASFGYRMLKFMDSLGVKYYFKKDLLRAMGIPPENFKQTWGCR